MLNRAHLAPPPDAYQRQLQRARAWLPLVIALALLLRLGLALGDRHNLDYAYPIWQALHTLDTGLLPATSQMTSAQIANPPLTGYLYLPWLALTGSALGAVLLVTALNTLAVWFTWRAALTLTGHPALALTAACLLAVNPWVAEYSRATWVQSLLPFFNCALAWLLWPVLTGAARRPFHRTLLALGLLALYINTYLLAFFALLPTGLLLLICRRRVPWRAVALGAGLALLLTLPYALTLLSMTDAGGQIARFTGETAAVQPTARDEAISHALRLVTGADYTLTRAPEAATVIALEALAATMPALALLVGLAAAIRAALRRDAPALILLITFGLPPLAMTFVGGSIHPFYQLLTLPAGHVLAAVGLAWLLDILRRARAGVNMRRVTGVGLVAAWGGVMIAGALAGSAAVAAAPSLNSLASLPLRDGLRLGALLRDRLPPGGVVFTAVDPWLPNSFAGRNFTVIRDQRAPAVSIAPAAGGVYLSSALPGQPLPDPPAFATRADQLRLADGAVIALDVYPAGGPDLTDFGQALNISTQQGLTLCCYTLTRHRNGRRWVLTIVWRVVQADPATSRDAFGSFAQIETPDGSPLTMADGAIIPGYDWRIGDVHVHRLTFALPADVGEFVVYVGQYDPYSGQNLTAVMPDGATLTRFPLPGPTP